MYQSIINIGYKMNFSDFRLKYCFDAASYRGATVLSVKNKLKTALKKLKISGLRDSPFGGVQFTSNGKDFEIVTQGQSGDPSHIGSLIVSVRGNGQRDRTSFDAFGQEQSAISKAVSWVESKAK